MLDKKQFQEIETICEKWLIPNRKFNQFDEIYSVLKDVDFSSAINFFTSRLEKVKYPFTKSEKISGSICFYGSVFTSLLNTGKIEEIEDLFTFALCYMLIDHFLDDNTISNEEKKKSMQEVFKFLIYNIETPGNKLIEAASKRYQSLVTSKPQCKEEIIKLFKSEIKGAAISQNEKLNREDYLKIAEEKGGRTSLTIASIIGLDISDLENNPHYQVGVCIQLVDDLIDLSDDESLEIYTLTRYDLDRGSLDRYIHETMVKIDNLKSLYNFFKPILLTGCLLGIHDNGHISNQLSSIVSQYNPFSNSTSKDSLNEWFHYRLYQYIEENKNDNVNKN